MISNELKEAVGIMGRNKLKIKNEKIFNLLMKKFKGEVRKGYKCCSQCEKGRPVNMITITIRGRKFKLFEGTARSSYYGKMCTGAGKDAWSTFEPQSAEDYLAHVPVFIINWMKIEANWK